MSLLPESKVDPDRGTEAIFLFFLSNILVQFDQINKQNNNNIKL